MGDNFSVLPSYAAGKASVRLRVQNRILRRLGYGRFRRAPTTFLCWVPGECNPADPFSPIKSVFGGDYRKAQLDAEQRLRRAPSKKM